MVAGEVVMVRDGRGAGRSGDIIFLSAVAVVAVVAVVVVVVVVGTGGSSRDAPEVSFLLRLKREAI